MIESDICVVTVAAGIDIDANTLALALLYAFAAEDKEEELPPALLPLLPIMVALTGCRDELRLPTS